ncbi:MAG: zinc ribbon domain-containing protein [Clostridia bacterium]|nr:zinc ribbon domain-containing protein [Clostridia bacterium]
MSVDVLDLKCRNCGAPLEIGAKKCEYCDGPVAISTFNSVATMPLPMVNKYAMSYQRDLSAEPDNNEGNTAIAYCYLKLKMYDKALTYFERAVVDNFDNSEVYFYAAICCLGGKRAFLSQKSAINKAEEYLNAAVMIEPKGIYYYLWAYIKYDYYKMKFLNSKPDFKEMLNMAESIGVSVYDKEQLFNILNAEKPSVL